MIYKKMSLRAMMLALAAVLVAAFASCSKSDGDKEDEDIPAAKATVTYEFEPCADELEFFDMTAQYLDGSGTMQTETITGKWKKEITYTTLPAKVKIIISHAIKPNVELTKETYLFDYKYTRDIKAYSANGVLLDSETRPYQPNPYTVLKENLPEFVPLCRIDESYEVRVTPNNVQTKKYINTTFD